MSKAVLFFADGTEECEALLVADLLRRAKVEVIIASAMGRRALVSPSITRPNTEGYLSSSRGSICSYIATNWTNGWRPEEKNRCL